MAAITSLLAVLLASVGARAQPTPTEGVQPVSGKALSIGVVFGDPLGATMKYRFGQPNGLDNHSPNAFDVGFGPDYFGSPRLQMDYLWEFAIFHSSVVRSYAGPGLAVAFAKGIHVFYTKEPRKESFSALEDNGFGFGGRAVFGFNYVPHFSRFEYFVEGGPFIGMNRIFDLDIDAAVGVRYCL